MQWGLTTEEWMQWRPWFAWRPVMLDNGRFCWLERIERRPSPVLSPMAVYEYRGIQHG